MGRRGKKRAEFEAAVADKAHVALHRSGRMLATTPDEIVAADEELRLGTAVPLPDGLSDPYAVWDGKGERKADVIRLSLETNTTEVRENLARAARDAGVIPEEIEERMRADRLAAERGEDGDED